LIVANVLYKSAVLESWGRGIALMVNECRRVGIPDPEFHTDGNAVWIVFHYTRTTVGQDPTATPQQPYSNPTVPPQLGKLLSAIGNNTLSAKEIMEKTGMKDKRNFLKNYIHPAINSGLVLSLYPVGSKSPQQKYYLTDKGKGFLQQ
ncbi:Fic family protein, partial [Bacteroides uniformis]|uniref:Fic family protein n=1 Tax=Bacteroides uniformis TaxID=820 RepID=UPI00140197D4